MGRQNGHSKAISIHALREEGDFAHGMYSFQQSDISIHALREEGDADMLEALTPDEISIHALREEGDQSG